MTAASSAIASTTTAWTLVLWINRGLEFLWLLTIVLVPLVFVSPGYMISETDGYVALPKIALLRTLAGLMLVLWLLEWGLKGRLTFDSFSREGLVWLRPSALASSLGGWLRAEPARWLTLAVSLYLGAILLSTFLSVSFRVSMWGDVPGQDSYATYTIAAYVALFAVIATHLKMWAQFQRILWAIVTMGLLFSGYAVLQHYGHDFFNLSIISVKHRDVTSTTGNAIFAGSVMVMTVPVTLLAAAAALREPLNRPGFWWKLGPWSLLLTVQLLGIIFTFSRGPWYGTFSALIVFLGLAAVFAGWRSFWRLALVLGLAAAFAAVIIYLPPALKNTGENTGPLTSPGVAASSPELRSTPRPPPSTAELTPSLVKSEVTSIVGATLGGLSGRAEIWEDSWRLMTRHPWFESEDLSLAFLRPIIGYGPDLFRTAYLLESDPVGASLLPGEPRQAHNFFIHHGVESGFLGLLASLSLFGAPLLVGSYLLLRNKQNLSSIHKLVLVGLLATLVGRMFEQMVGVSRASDLTIFWVLLGMLVVLPLATQNREEAENHPEKAPTTRRGARAHPPLAQVSQVSSFNAKELSWRLALATGIIVGIFALTWFKTINYPRAAVLAGQAGEQFQLFDFQGAIASLDRAIDLAPDVASYYHSRATVYRSFPLNSQVAPERGCSSQGDSGPYRVCLETEAYSGNLKGADQRPNQFRSKLALADSTLSLGLLTQDRDLVTESTVLYQEVTEMMPQSWMLANRLAEVYSQLGQPELALPAVEKSLSITGESVVHSIDALIIRGLAYRRLGQPDKAIEELSHVIELADLYRVQTSQGLVSIRDEAIMAYNERAITYYELGQFQRALEDYGHLLEQKPELAEGYAGRALVHTQLGMDAEAERDAGRAVELGFDSNLLNGAIEALRLSR